MKNGFLLGLVCIISLQLIAQSRYLVRFKDKATTPFSIAAPAAYLSQKAIDRRTRNNTVIDSTDLPVTPSYLDSISHVPGVIILNVSKWLNQVSIQTNSADALSQINAFPFVKTTRPIANRFKNTEGNSIEKFINPTSLSTQKEQGTPADSSYYGSSFNQVHIHNGEFLHNIGLQGQDMVIGMLDAGFYHYTSLKSFDSINANHQILGTYDFVNRKTSVVEENYHGMACLSTMAANIPGTFVGTAPKAYFYLFKTEDVATEYPIEEHNWVCGAERLDSAGVDVITSSLGYTMFDNAAYNHTYADLNGHTTMAAIGASLAVKKGMLVFNAAGNDGNSSWHYISTPADADSVLAVGAVTINGQPASFSSYGPSPDGRVKPDVASVGAGTIVQYGNDAIGPSNGTSFACPNMAGLATCLWQGFRELRNSKIIEALRRSGSIAAAPDNRIGYGIPDVKKALLFLLKEIATASATSTNCNTTLTWTSKDAASMIYEVERKTPGGTAFVKLVTITANGKAFTNQTYQYTDTFNTMAAGTVQYRIRQIIDTAAATFTRDYIDTITVNSAFSCPLVTAVTGSNISINPNPARSSAVLKINNGPAIENLYIRVINSIGQVVYTLRTAKPAGSATYTLPIASLAKGKYFVSLFNSNALIATKQFIKL